MSVLIPVGDGIEYSVRLWQDEAIMARYECSVCGYIYDEDQEGARWDALPEDWACPACGADKSLFNRLGDTVSADQDAPALAKSDGRPDRHQVRRGWVVTTRGSGFRSSYTQTSNVGKDEHGNPRQSSGRIRR